MKRFAKAFQEFDKLHASIQVYADYNQAEIYQEIEWTPEVLEEYRGRYENTIAELRRRNVGPNDDGDGPVIDIEYELESIRTDEVNYHYIISLIQNLIDNKEDSLTQRDKDVVDRYIEDLAAHNSKLAQLIEKIWQEAKENNFQGESVAHQLDLLIEKNTEQLLATLADEWAVGLEELKFVASNYRQGLEKQIGEKALTDSADYARFKSKQGDDAPKKIRYKNIVKKNLFAMIEEEILPLKGR